MEDGELDTPVTPNSALGAQLRGYSYVIHIKEEGKVGKLHMKLWKTRTDFSNVDECIT